MANLADVHGTGHTPARGLPGCAAVARMLGADPGGTATVMSSWLLIEQPGPWPAGALEETVAGILSDERIAALRSMGLRPLLIRRPGRQRREQRPRTVFVGSGRPGSRWLERIELDELADVAALDLEAVARGHGGHGEPVDGPMFLVCTHGAKDMCCAVLGRPVAATLAENHPSRCWEVSHVGGDRWAGNLLVVPDGQLHGQLAPNEAALVAKAAMAGQVRPDFLRGRTSAPTQWEQYAEIAVRRHTGLDGVDDVLALDSTEDGAEHRVVVSAGRQRYEVVVRGRATSAAEVSRCSPRVAVSGYTVEGLRLLSGAVC